MKTKAHDMDPGNTAIADLFKNGLDKKEITKATDTDSPKTGNNDLQGKLRGSNAKILEEFLNDPKSKTLVDKVMSMGDAHLENLGFYKDKDGKVKFNFNDFDQSSKNGNYKFDLMMGAMSIMAVGKDKGFSDTQVKDLLTDYFKTYTGELKKDTDDLKAGKDIKDPDFDGSVKKLEDKLNDPAKCKEKGAEWLAKKVKDDKLITGLNEKGKGFEAIPEPGAAQKKTDIIASLKAGSPNSVLENMAKKLGVKVEDLQISDIAIRKAGNGSAGSKCYAILVKVPGHDPEQVIMDMKEAKPSSSDPKGKGKDNDKRVEDIADKTLKDNSTHFGTTKIGTKEFYVSDYSYVTSKDIDPNDKDKPFTLEDLKSLALAEAKLLANLHAKSGKGDEILKENKDGKMTGDVADLATELLGKL